MITIFTAPAERRLSTAATVVLPASWVLLFTGITFVAYAGYVIADAAVYQRIQTTTLESAKPTAYHHASIGMASRHKLAIGEVIGEIRVPRLGIKAIVLEGDSQKILRRAVGHVPSTALPGEIGNSALAGHRDALFRSLRNIRLGDLVTFQTSEGEFRYEVNSVQIVSPDEVKVLLPSTAKELTLITCFPFSYVGSAPNRYIVRATQLAEIP